MNLFRIYYEFIVAPYFFPLEKWMLYDREYTHAKYTCSSRKYADAIKK